MRDAVIVAAVRSPIGKRGGALSGIHPVDLLGQVLNGLQRAVDLEPSLVEDVICGCVTQTGEQAANIARYAVFSAGWPDTVPATTVDRQCGSSQQAVHFAAAGVVAGHYDVVVAAGVESMSRVPMLCTVDQGPGTPNSPGVYARYGDELVTQGISAELIAEKWSLSRAYCDEIGLRSHERSATATRAGCFEDEIVPIRVSESGQLVSVDEGIRANASFQAMSELKPAFREDGVITAGNSSQISDGAAALLIMSGDRAAEVGLRPLARLHSFAVVGVDPIFMLTGPIPATEKVLDKARLRASDIGVFEVNEAFASVVGAWEADIGVDPSRINPNGGAIALGHPLGASGARVMTTLVHEMKHSASQWGLQAMCEGNGMANATVFELLTTGAA